MFFMCVLCWVVVVFVCFYFVLLLVGCGYWLVWLVEDELEDMVEVCLLLLLMFVFCVVLVFR